MTVAEAMLIDTNVLSELLRARPDDTVLDWFAAQNQDQLFTSTITQAEMWLGVKLLPAGKRQLQLQEAVDGLFRHDFTNRVLPFDHAAAQAYAGVVTARRRAGRPISQFDAQIAAIAISRDMALATRNTADFEGCDLDLRNPWNAID